MTNQEAFDKMMKHLRSLEERSFDESRDACVYNGSKCAIGALMTDEEQERFGDYHGGVDGLGRIMSRVGYTSTLHDLDPWLLIDMQNLHDVEDSWSDEGFIAEWEAKIVANRYNLIYTKP